jgi:aminoglycoside phosphotransferase (APT) family kinase protein
MRTKPGPAAKLLPSAHAIEREFRVMSALAGTVCRCRACMLLCEDESVIGRAFYVMEFVDRPRAVGPGLPGMTPPERAPSTTR